MGSSSQVQPASGNSGSANTSSGGSNDNSQQANTTQTSSSSAPSKSWVLIGSYTGSGSGTKTINVTAAVNATQGKVLFYLNNIIDFNGDRKNLILSGVKVVE